jgi:hypothetical protein
MDRTSPYRRVTPPGGDQGLRRDMSVVAVERDQDQEDNQAGPLIDLRLTVSPQVSRTRIHSVVVDREPADRSHLAAGPVVVDAQVADTDQSAPRLPLNRAPVRRAASDRIPWRAPEAGVLELEVAESHWSTAEHVVLDLFSCDCTEAAARPFADIRS